MRGDDGRLVITPELAIPWSELSLRATPGGGPGGQHVNRSATRVDLSWNVRESPSLTDEQRALLLENLASRLDRRGKIRLTAGARRSQARNREAVIERFIERIAAALQVAPPRKPTKASRAVKARRLESKRRQGDQKRLRRKVDREGDDW